jgi:uncharacterized tellurite resistance protein B-like protein
MNLKWARRSLFVASMPRGVDENSAVLCILEPWKVFGLLGDCDVSQPLNEKEGRDVGLAKFANILRVFGGSIASDEDRAELLKEALFMTLSRATSSDVNILPVEVEAVQSIMKSVSGEEVSAADVRVAAASEIYESASLDDYLAAAGRKLAPADRHTLMKCLADVIKSDRRISEIEIDFFDRIAHALRASPAEVAGLLETD